MTVRIIEATDEHARAIIPHLRELEMGVTTALRLDAEWVVRTHVEKSVVAFSAFVPDAEYPAVMWGVQRQSPLGPGEIWIVSTGLIYRYPFTFLEESKKFLEAAKAEFGVIQGVTYFEASCRWIEWLGLHKTKSEHFRGMQLHHYST